MADANLSDGASASSSPLSSPCDSHNATSPDASDLEFGDADADADAASEHVTGRSAESSASTPDHLRTPRAEGQNSTKRKRADMTPPPGPRFKPISPPWRKAEADGPSTILENGRRKSGRLVTLVPPPTPLLSSGTKRSTRGVSTNQQSPPTKSREAIPAPNLRGTSTRLRPSTTSGLKASLRPTRTSAKSTNQDAKATPTRHSFSPKQLTQGSRRSARHARTDESRDEEGQPRTASKIKLRVRSTIPLVHPGQAKVINRIADSFDKWWDIAHSIPVSDGGLLINDEPVYTAETAAKDAEILARIEKELEPGGILTEERCVAFAPEVQPLPTPQYAQIDHLLKAAANLKRLMIVERNRHRSTAKKLAEACRDKWLQLQPKTAEELETEARERWFSQYKLVLKTLAGTWDNVREEINKHRYKEYQAEEQRRVKAALNEAVNLSEQKLAQRTGHLPSDEEGALIEDESTEDDSESETPDDERDDQGDEDDEDDSMPSSSDVDENDVEVDAALTQDQLRTKYANIPELDQVLQEAVDIGGEHDTSDESIDMDDDIGSSEDDDDVDDDSADGDHELEEAQYGLLGMLFGKEELQSMKEHELDEMEADDTMDDVGTEAGDYPDASDASNWDDIETEENFDAVMVPEEELPEEEEVSLIPTGEERVGPSPSPRRISPNSTPIGRPSLVEDVPNTRSDHGSPSGFIKLTDDIPLTTILKTSSPLDGTQDLYGASSPSQRVTPVRIVVEIPGRVSVANSRASESMSRSSQDPVAQASQSLSRSSKDCEDYFPPGCESDQGLDPQDIRPDRCSTPDPYPKSQVSNMAQTLNKAEAKSQLCYQCPPHHSGRQNTPRPETGLQSSPLSESNPESLPTVEIADNLNKTTGATSHDMEIPTSDYPSDSVNTHEDKDDGLRSESPQPTPKTEIPSLLRGTLREYQHYGLDWLAGLYANRTNGILADEMGLGKTIQTIALLAHLACNHEVWGPHLVIVPTSVMLNWEMEFKKWCPGFKILAYYGSQDERKRKRQGWTNDDVWNVCITSYQLVLQDHQVFRRRRWHYMILDEAHNIKNFKSQRWQTLLGFNTHSRLLLTGTPLQNNLTELWSLLFFLMPGENQANGFADLDEFRQWFSRPESQILESGRERMDDEARAIIAKLHQVLRPYLLRRLKADVERQMPAKFEHVEMCRLSKRQRELYDGFLSRSDTRQTLSSGNYLSIINCLMQLRKVCNHPDLFIDRPIMTSFKMRKSVAADYRWTEHNVRRALLRTDPLNTVSLGYLNLVPAKYEGMSSMIADRLEHLSIHHELDTKSDIQKKSPNFEVNNNDLSTVHLALCEVETRARTSQLNQLRQSAYVSAIRKQQRPIFGKNLVDLLTIRLDWRLRKPRPKLPSQIIEWFEDESFVLNAMMPHIDQVARSHESTIAKFSCVTPAVITGDLTQLILGDNGTQAFRDEDLRLSKPVRWAPFMPKERPLDPWHEARMRLSIQFPDKRLLQYDCGKLQTLDRLLRQLQAGGHRALIFTQMTKVLDILEQFLNIHGHKYLRLDGATHVEQRQILTDRFNHDTRILCFILSTRSGGLGINLTGADTVIFYDQDWNPAMDKQCQDRCHRIGQTRDVHIYRLVSEHTIEANILRKASQKQMLDDVVIQEGEFTTDYFKRLSVRDVIGDGGVRSDESAANAAMDRLLSGAEGTDRKATAKVLEQAEDREDVVAAKAAEKETQADDADFDDKPQEAKKDLSRALTPQATPKVKGPAAHNADGDHVGTIDNYMLGLMKLLVQGTVLELPKNKKSKKRKDTRKR